MNGKQYASVSGSYSTIFIGSWSLVSQNVAGNYSVIRLYGTFRYGGGTSVGSSSSTFKLNGTTIKTGSYRYYPGDTQLGTKDITVYHNSDGTFPTQTVSISANSYHIKNKTASGTISGVKTIPRASSVGISSSSVTMGNSINISINRASSSFSHTLTYKFGSATGTIGTGVETSKLWSIPLNLANQIPNSTSGVGTIYCYTYSGSTHVGTSSINFTAKVPSNIIPSFESLTLQRVDNTVPPDWGLYVKTKSSCVAKINGASGSYGSTISSYSITGCGYSSTSSTLTTGVLNKAGTITFTAKVKDTRGRIATKTQSITVVDYSGPNIQGVLTQRCLQDGTLDDDGTYAKCNATISHSTCNNKNTLTKKVCFRKSGENNWSGEIVLTDGAVIGGGNIDVDYSYNIKYKLSDAFTTLEFIDIVSTAFTTADYRKGGKGVAFGKVSEKEAFECAMQAEFTKGLYVNGGASMFNPQYVPNGTDFNTLTLIGDYYNSKTSDCCNMLNAPALNSFLLEVRKNGGIIYQTYKRNAEGIAFIRYYWDWKNKWTDWKLIAGQVLLYSGCMSENQTVNISHIDRYERFMVEAHSWYPRMLGTKTTDNGMIIASSICSENSEMHVTGAYKFTISGTNVTLTLANWQQHFKNGNHNGPSAKMKVKKIWGLP